MFLQNPELDSLQENKEVVKLVDEYLLNVYKGHKISRRFPQENSQSDGKLINS